MPIWKPLRMSSIMLEFFARAYATVYVGWAAFYCLALVLCLLTCAALRLAAAAIAAFLGRKGSLSV